MTEIIFTVWAVFRHRHTPQWTPSHLLSVIKFVILWSCWKFACINLFVTFFSVKSAEWTIRVLYEYICVDQSTCTKLPFICYNRMVDRKGNCKLICNSNRDIRIIRYVFLFVECTSLSQSAIPYAGTVTRCCLDFIPILIIYSFQCVTVGAQQ